MGDSQTPPEDSQRLLVVVAHPDDETFGCGSLLLHAAGAGMTTAVLCATRGEAGESVIDVPPGGLAEVREAETRAAAVALGVGQVDFLDFHDSGMAGPTEPSTLVGAPIADVRDRVAEYIDAFRPTTIITLDGMDGHRDHLRIGEATVAALDVAEHQVDRVYLHCLPQSKMQQWVDHMTATDPSWEQLQGDMPGTPDDQITTTIDTSEHLPAREAAMRLHASQRSPVDGLPDDLRTAFLTSDSLRRVVPEWTGGPQETSLA